MSAKKVDERRESSLMKIVCDACGAKYSIADEKVAGKVFKIRCKKCSNIIVVRGVKEEVDAAEGGFGHDEKETRVFDYSGYDDPQSAVAASEADGAIWHLVIDQEQVGPMTADEVRGRFSAGEIEADSFVWREGFDDWERLDALAEFADLAAGAPAGDEVGAAMFGGPALDDPLADSGDPADLFTAQATGQAAPVDDGGLFGDAGADDGGLFGASEPMAAAAPEPVDERLTGQRNENSVLFSLNNLASLASDSSPKTPAVSTSSAAPAASGGSQTTASQDGSGLIDIRAMASMYMGDSGGPAPSSASGGGIDDLPVFSQPSIAAASPVLMPVAAPANSNKLMVALIAGIGALVLVAVILLVLVLRGGDEKEVAASESGDNAASMAANTNNATKPADTGDSDDGSDGDSDGDTPAADTAAADDKSDDSASDDKEGSGRTVAKTDKPKAPERKETAREKRARLKKEREERERKERERKSRDDKPEKPDTGGGGGCDEITCLVDSSKPCCRKSGGGRSSNKSSGSNLPDRPTKAQVRSGMGRVSGAVRSCGKRNGFSGKVRVKIRIAGSGRVSSASASGGPGSVNSCVSSAVKRARFPKTQNGLSFTYGYTL